MGHLAYVDFGMMDSISDSDRITLTGAIVHLINGDFESLIRILPIIWLDQANKSIKQNLIDFNLLLTSQYNDIDSQ